MTNNPSTADHPGPDRSGQFLGRPLYTADIQHVLGVNVVAEALSRPPVEVAVVPTTSTGWLNWAQLATAQKTWEDLADLHTKQTHHLEAVQLKGFPMWCDVSMGVWRPVVPQDFRRRCLTPSMGWFTQEHMPPHSWSATGLCGQDCF